MTNFSFSLVKKVVFSQSRTSATAKQYAVELLPNGTVGDLVRAARDCIPVGLRESHKVDNVDIDDLQIQAYLVRSSQCSCLIWF